MGKISTLSHIVTHALTVATPDGLADHHAQPPPRTIHPLSSPPLFPQPCDSSVPIHLIPQQKKTSPSFVTIRVHSWFKSLPHTASTPGPDVQNAASSANLHIADSSTEPAATTNTQLSSR